MSQCTPTAMAKEPERERAHSSWRIAVVRRSAPAPPYFSSYSTPRNPSSPMRAQIPRGIRPACSHSSTCGMISFSTKDRTVARNMSCCSLKIFTRLVPRPLIRDLLRILGNRATGDDVHAAAQLHHLADRALERLGRSGRISARRQLHAQRERVFVTLAPDDDLEALYAVRARRHFVGLARVDEHAAHLRHLVGAAAPAQHA